MSEVPHQSLDHARTAGGAERPARGRGWSLWRREERLVLVACFAFAGFEVFVLLALVRVLEGAMGS